MNAPASLRLLREFADRRDAGRRLAQRLSEYARQPDVVVLALPRGGVLVGYEVALALQAPFDVFVVRKLGVPGQEELALGAIASGGIRVLNDDIVQQARLSAPVIDAITGREEATLHERERAYRDGRPAFDVRGRTVILVDDGLATGASMRAAIVALRLREPRQIVVAVPVGTADGCAAMGMEADRVVCATTPRPLYSISLAYADFTQTSDVEVNRLLSAASTARAAETRR
jgi:predicted phosphoribosyltransferase